MKIEHIAMYVNNLEQAKKFFVKYLDGKANKMYHNIKTDFRRTGYIHVAFSVGSREKVNELTNFLKTDGYEVISGPRTTGDGYYESCIIAVEGNQIEITV